MCGDPGNTCAYGLHWLLCSSCTPVTVCGLIRCRGNSVMECSRATGALQAADRVTCQSVPDLMQSGRISNTKQSMLYIKDHVKVYILSNTTEVLL